MYIQSCCVLKQNFNYGLMREFSSIHVRCKCAYLFTTSSRLISLSQWMCRSAKDVTCSHIGVQTPQCAGSTLTFARCNWQCTCQLKKCSTNRKVNWITVFDSSSWCSWPLSAGICSYCNFQSVISRATIAQVMASHYGTYKSIADVNFLGADCSRYP